MCVKTCILIEDINYEEVKIFKADLVSWNRLKQQATCTQQGKTKENLKDVIFFL